MRGNRHDRERVLNRLVRPAAAVLAGLAVAGAATAVFAAPAPRDGGPRSAQSAAPSDAQIAQQTVERYFRLLDEGRGAEFCSGAITAETLQVEGGIYRCAATISGYVRNIERRSFAATLQDLHDLFMMVSDGIGLHCQPGKRCPSSLYGRWASENAGGEVDWRTADDPRLASSTGTKVVAVVDPRHSSPSWITLYYQAWDGRILRASWSTELGRWKGSVVDTHAGVPFVSDVQLVDVTRVGPRSMVAHLTIRIGTRPPELQEFRLVREYGTWRADSWRPVAGPPAV